MLKQDGVIADLQDGRPVHHELLQVGAQMALLADELIRAFAVHIEQPAAGAVELIPVHGRLKECGQLGKPAADVTLAWNVASTSINAVLSVVAAVAIYMALRPALKKAGLQLRLTPHHA